MPTTKPESDPRGDNQVLDKALVDTFPASDPPAATSIATAIPPPAEAEETCDAFLVLTLAMADKPLAEWRTCGQARWLSPNTPALMLALSPALALLDALTCHGLDASQAWVLAHVRFPLRCMLRLDTPHECWRERTFRNDVRLFGDRWALEQQSALLRVPSPLCPREYNLLVNFLHADAGDFDMGEICPLELDPRLRTG